MQSLSDTFFNVAVFREVIVHLLKGLGTTLALSALTIPLGVAQGLALALLGQHRRRWLRLASMLYVDLFRAFPPLVLLIFVSFATPFFGLSLPAIVSIAITFMISSAAYYGEILRAGLESVPPGQAEAARASGLGRVQTLRLVLLPQAVRNVLPDLVGNSVEIVKMTALASVLGMPELLRSARDAQSLLYSPSPIVLAALIYLTLLWPAVRWISYLEQRHRAPG